MSVRFDPNWTYRGLRALVIENDHLRITILPELGAKIWSIVAKAIDQEMLWHNPRVHPRPAAYGSTYDNWFCGGWDEIFPNDYPVTIDGEPWPDHGEIWAVPADWSLVANTTDQVSIRFEHSGIAIPTRFVKTITLRYDSTDVEVGYEITNLGRTDLDMHWKLHPALPVRTGATLHLPADNVIVDQDFGEDSELPPVLPGPDSGVSYFQYGIGLQSGSCAITYPGNTSGFGLTFDHTVLNSVWVFASFGGWRGLNTIILEPCTGHYADLHQAIANGSARRLNTSETHSTSVTASILTTQSAIDAYLARSQS